MPDGDFTGNGQDPGLDDQDLVGIPIGDIDLGLRGMRGNAERPAAEGQPPRHGALFRIDLDQFLAVRRRDVGALLVRGEGDPRRLAADLDLGHRFHGLEIDNRQAVARLICNKGLARVRCERGPE